MLVLKNGDRLQGRFIDRTKGSRIIIDIDGERRRFRAEDIESLRPCSVAVFGRKRG
jgi:hypothetical protein